jgi:hypothetical protein
MKLIKLGRVSDTTKEFEAGQLFDSAGLIFSNECQEVIQARAVYQQGVC